MMAAPPRYTLVQNQRRQALFEQIWERYPWLRGDHARTLDFTLGIVADGVPRLQTDLPKHTSNIAPVEVEAIPELEIDNDIFAEVEI